MYKETSFKLTSLPGWNGISGPPVTSTATTPASYRTTKYKLKETNITQFIFIFSRFVQYVRRFQIFTIVIYKMYENNERNHSAVPGKSHRMKGSAAVL